MSCRRSRDNKIVPSKVPTLLHLHTLLKIYFCYIINNTIKTYIQIDTLHIMYQAGDIHVHHTFCFGRLFFF